MKSEAVPGRLMASLALVMVVETAFSSILAPLLPQLVARLDLTKSQAGALTSAYALGTFVGPLIALPLVRRFGVRATTGAALIVLGLATAWFALASTLAPALAARLGSGVAGGVGWAAAISWLLMVGGARERGRTIGTAFSISLIGTLLGPVLGAAASTVGLLPVLLSMAASCFVLAVSLPAGPAVALPPDQSARPSSHASYTSLVASSWMVVALALAYGALMVLLPLRLASHGMTGTGLGWLFACCAVVSAAVNRWSGRRADARGTRRLSATSMVGTAGLLLALAASTSPWLQAAAVVAGLGGILSLGMAPNATAVSRDASRSGFSDVTGTVLLLVLFSLGQVAGSNLGPSIAQAWTDSAAFLGVFLVCICSLPVLLLTDPGVERAQDQQQTVQRSREPQRDNNGTDPN